MDLEKFTEFFKPAWRKVLLVICIILVYLLIANLTAPAKIRESGIIIFLGPIPDGNMDISAGATSCRDLGPMYGPIFCSCEGRGFKIPWSEIEGKTVNEKFYVTSISVVYVMEYNNKVICVYKTVPNAVPGVSAI
jgi:hypothetical protein